MLVPKSVAFVRCGEADGQLVDLVTTGVADAVDSDDGDIIVHGVPELYTKVNYKTGAAYRYLASSWDAKVAPSIAQATALDGMAKIAQESQSKSTSSSSKAAKEASDILKQEPLWRKLVSLGIVSQTPHPNLFPEASWSYWPRLTAT